MLTSSKKNKGRTLCKKLKEALLNNTFYDHVLGASRKPDLKDDDIIVTPSGVTGPDLHLSPRAKGFYPFKFECKNQEKLNLMEAWKQAKAHKGPEKPVLVISKNRLKEPLVVMELSDWLSLL